MTAYHPNQGAGMDSVQEGLPYKGETASTWVQRV